MLTRLTLPMWAGAAFLFVITSVAEVTSTSPFVTSPVKDVLITTRFPPYYYVGWTLLGLGAVSCLLTLGYPLISKLRLSVVLLLTLLAIATMFVDYKFIYLPLEEMVIPPGKSRPQGFVSLHNASQYINFFDVSLVFLASLLICWPGSVGKLPKIEGQNQP